MRLLEPAQLAGCHVQLVEAVRDVGVIVEEPGTAHAARAVAPGQPAAHRERPEQELRYPARSVHEVGAPEPPPGLGECCQGETVPRGDRLVVALRLRPPLPRLEQTGALVLGQPATQDRSPVLEGLEHLVAPVAQHLAQLFGCPGERQPLDALRVRVLRRSEARPPAAQLPQHVVERPLGRPRGIAPRRSPPRRGGTPERAARCRRASSRSAARASARRRSSGGSRRRRGRACRRLPSPSSVRCTIESASSSPDRSWTRSRNSSVEAGGNFGAPPQPPCVWSNPRSQRRAAHRRGAQADSGSARGQCPRRQRRSHRRARCACRATSPRRSRQASAIAASTSRKLGSPWRGSGG